MARRWRVLNRRRARKLRGEPNPYIKALYCHHQWSEEYYGTRCKKCDTFFAFGCEPWDYYDDHGYSSAVDDGYDDGECDSDCWHCGGDGFVDGYEEDPIFFAPGEMEPCLSCGGSGRAKDMTVW
jgi:hypothetical protein